MIIACPACATRYAVPDSAIGIDGRTVRCAKCRHSWFQEGPQVAAAPAASPQPAPPAAAPPPPAPPPPPPPPPLPPVAEPEPAAPSLAEMARAAAAAAPAEQPPPVEEPVAAPVYADEVSGDHAEEHSSFAYEPPFRPRRNRAKMWMIAAVVFALMALGAIGAVAWYGLPNWVPLSRNTFAEARPDLVLDFPPGRQDRRTLPNGAEFFGA